MIAGQETGMPLEEAPEDMTVRAHGVAAAAVPPACQLAEAGAVEAAVGAAAAVADGAGNPPATKPNEKITGASI